MALDFEASSTDRIYYTPVSTPTYPLTLACWVNMTDLTVSRVFLSAGDSAGTDHLYLVLTGDPNNEFRAVHFAAGVSYTSVVAAATGWHHLVGTFASVSSRQLFYDGVAQTANTSTGTSITTDRLSIGVSADSTPFGDLDGAIAECAVWNRTLSQAEISMLADGFSPQFITDSLIMYDPCTSTVSRNKISDVTVSSYGDPLNYPHPNIIYPTNRQRVITFPPPVVAPPAEHRFRWFEFS